MLGRLRRKAAGSGKRRQSHPPVEVFSRLRDHPLPQPLTSFMVTAARLFLGRRFDFQRALQTTPIFIRKTRIPVEGFSPVSREKREWQVQNRKTRGEG